MPHSDSFDTVIAVSEAVDFPWLIASNGCPAPGRRRIEVEQARTLLVDSSEFVESETRPTLWDGLLRYLARFAYLEERHASLLDDIPLVHFLWMGGSFVSGELNPNNIDVTVAVDARAKERLKGRELAGWLRDAFYRDQVLADFGLSPLEIPYMPVVSVFDRRSLEPSEREYLESRGSWDDWWQRRRDPQSATGEPSPATVGTKRGYLEVIL